jgi:hypothetical protein
VGYKPGAEGQVSYRWDRHVSEYAITFAYSHESTQAHLCTVRCMNRITVIIILASLEAGVE